jgi:HEPN domain-containing protein
VVTKEEAEVLKERALAFLENAEDLVRKKSFDIAAFAAEQFCQLYLKYKLLLVFGDFPKTHSLRFLLAEVAKVRPARKIGNFVKENASIIGNLESAYVTSRYLPRKFGGEEVKEMLTFAKKFKKFVDGL